MHCKYAARVPLAIWDDNLLVPFYKVFRLSQLTPQSGVEMTAERKQAQQWWPQSHEHCVALPLCVRWSSFTCFYRILSFLYCCNAYQCQYHIFDCICT